MCDGQTYPIKVSVAIIAYNHERFIAQAIDSVLAQQIDFAYEIVIGDDCSRDATPSIILDFESQHPEQIIPILRTQNVGAMQNFADTIAACRGQYIAFLEGDDFWTSVDKLQRQVDFLDTHPDRSMCCHKVRCLRETETAENEVIPTLPAGTYSLEDLMKQNFILTGSLVLRRDLIPHFPHWFFRMKMGDWPLCAMVAQHGTIELLDDVMGVYRFHSSGMWSSLPPETRVREVTRMLTALDQHFGFRYTCTIRRTIAPPYLELAQMARTNRRRIETARHLINYFRHGGLRLPVNFRLLIGLSAYILVGSGYRIFSRAGGAIRGKI